jgi:hypothetical protein
MLSFGEAVTDRYMHGVESRLAATRLILFSTLLSIWIPLSSAQQLDRVKVAEGEYRVMGEGTWEWAHRNRSLPFSRILDSVAAA